MTERMSDERLDHEIRGYLAWQAEDVAGAPSAAEAAVLISDRVGTAPARLSPAPQLAWVLLAGLLVIALLGALVAGANRPPSLPLAVTDDASPPASLAPASPLAVSPAPTTVASPSLPSLRLPGTLGGPAGEYGWEGGLHAPGGLPSGMHKVIGYPQSRAGREVIAMLFRVGSDCLKARQEQQVPVRVNGFDGVVVEPYEPPVPFGSPMGIEITRAYQLDVGGRHLCVYLTWHPTTTDDEIDAAAGLLDSLRAEAIGEDRIRIVLSLDGGWDTG